MRRLCTLLMIVAAMALTTVSSPSVAQACSTFCFGSDEGPIFGKNYDWHIGDGMVLVNMPGVSKTAMAGENPASWTSTYGSVTFNQYGREWPSGGMNEAGLVVELMWLEDTEYPPPDDRGALGSLQWVQYQMDNSATIDDVAASDRDIRITRATQGKIHFLVGDRSGAVASIEFIGGKMVVHRDDAMPAKVLTNSTYERSAEALSKYDGFGGSWAVPKKSGSIDRFVRAADLVARYDKEHNAVTYAFEVLRKVNQGDRTQWSIVYDIDAAHIYFRTRATTYERRIDLNRIVFACSNPVLMLDIDVFVDGDVMDHFVPYTTEANFDLMQRAFRGTPFLKHVPQADIREFSAYPDHVRCAQ